MPGQGVIEAPLLHDLAAEQRHQMARWACMNRTRIGVAGRSTGIGLPPRLSRSFAAGMSGRACTHLQTQSRRLCSAASAASKLVAPSQLSHFHPPEHIRRNKG